MFKVFTTGLFLCRIPLDLYHQMHMNEFRIRNEISLCYILNSEPSARVNLFSAVSECGSIGFASEHWKKVLFIEGREGLQHFHIYHSHTGVYTEVSKQSILNQPRYMS